MKLVIGIAAEYKSAINGDAMPSQVGQRHPVAALHQVDALVRLARTVRIQRLEADRHPLAASARASNERNFSS